MRKSTGMSKPISLGSIITFVVFMGINYSFAGDIFLEQIAQEVAFRKTELTQIRAQSEYTGHYNGTHAGCDYVSIKRVWDPTFRQKSRIDLHNFKVCQERVINTGETGVEYLPDSVKSYIPTFSKACQQKGAAEYEQDEFLILCLSLRDKDMCLVEVNTLRDERLIASDVVNGCN